MATADLKSRAEKNRLAGQRRSRDASAQAADIGELPDVVNPERRAACERDLHRFLVEYFPESTGLKPFSQEHDAAFQRMQIATIDGGRFLNLFPRGFAKTTCSENAVLWATLYGHRKFVPFFGANATASAMSIESMVREITDNDLLCEDFPEVCIPFRALEGKYQRCRSQTYHGELTNIRAAQDRLVFPDIAGKPSAGAMIMVRSLQGGTRGLKYKRNGVQQRPDLVIIDDPQDDETARSDVQVNKLLETIKRSILRLGGHDKQIAVIMNATPIEEGDLVHQIEADPSWLSMRVKMLPQRADLEEEFWLGEYASTRQTYDPTDAKDQGRAKRDATELYRRKQAEADAGAVVSWEHCYADDELSAVQHAYNILIDEGPFVFASECQCEPQNRFQESEFLKNTEIRERLSGFGRGVVPPDATHLTAFVDVQQQALFYVLCAWGDGFTGYVVDYGTFPEQRLPYFSLDSLNPKLSTVFKGASIEEAITGGLDKTIENLLGRTWRRADGAEMSVDICLVDEGAWTQLVNKTVMSNPHKSRIIPSTGMAERASHRVPFAEYKKKQGERTGGGYPWRLTKSNQPGNPRHVLSEVNWWKSFIQKRLLIGKGGTGSLTLYGNEAAEHRLISDHLTAEYLDRQTSEATGRTVDQWMLKPGRPDNHWLDGVVGCAVGASIMGVKLAEVLPSNVKKGKKLKLSEIQARKRR